MTICAELLAALEAFRESVPDNRHAETASVDPYHIEPEVLAQIDAAIARAKSETSEHMSSLRVRVAAKSDEDARRISAVLVALGYEVERDMTLASSDSRVAWAALEIGAKFKLTERETHFVRQLLSGYSFDDLVPQFGISKATVKWHMHSVYTKTATNNLAELLLLGIRTLAGES